MRHSRPSLHDRVFPACLMGGESRVEKRNEVACTDKHRTTGRDGDSMHVTRFALVPSFDKRSIWRKHVNTVVVAVDDEHFAKPRNCRRGCDAKMTGRFSVCSPAMNQRTIEMKDLHTAIGAHVQRVLEKRQSPRTVSEIRADLPL